jgi:hypothetical protein
MIIDFDRDSLYLEVSTTPISTLAKKYGLSDVGLRKVCIRLDIPLPGRGHWQKLAAGKSSTMPPLPPAKGLTRVQCSPIEAVLTPAPAKAEWLEARLSFEKDPLNQITVSATLDVPSDLVKEAKKAAALQISQIQQGRKDEIARDKHPGGWRMPENSMYMHWWDYSRRGCFDLTGGVLPTRVSMQSVDRALRIWDAIVKTAEARGLALNIEANRLQLSAHGQTVEMRMAERIARVVGPTKGRSAVDVMMNSHITMQPTGELRIFFGEKKFSDTRVAALDDQLNAVFAYVFKSLNRERIRELERIEQRRVSEERSARLAARVEEAKERARLVAEERDRESGLEAEAAAWRRAQELRTYTAAVSAATPLPAPAHIREWIDWANSVASRIDPLPGRVAVVGAAAPAVLATPRTKKAES